MFSGIQVYEGSKSAVQAQVNRLHQEHDFGVPATITEDGKAFGCFIDGVDAHKLLKDTFNIDLPVESLTMSSAELQANPALMAQIMSKLPKMQALFASESLEETLEKITAFARQAVKRGTDEEGNKVSIRTLD